jgi:hypothetical protein
VSIRSDIPRACQESRKKDENTFTGFLVSGWGNIIIFEDRMIIRYRRDGGKGFFDWARESRLPY